MASKGNHPQMALIQVGELSKFTDIPFLADKSKLLYLDVPLQVLQSIGSMYCNSKTGFKEIAQRVMMDMYHNCNRYCFR